MPLTGIHCASPRYRRNHEEVEVSLSACLDCAHSRENDCHFTYELLSSMYAQQQDRGARITTTTLTSKCLRSEFLKRSLPYAERPEKMWASFRGTMYHGQLEKHAAPGAIEEPRFHVELELGHFSGSPDLVDVRYGVVYDYKVTKEVPKFAYAWAEHVAQLNINRWLVDNADYVEYRGETYALTDDVVAPEEGVFHADVRTNISKFRPTVWNDLVVVYMDDKGPKPISCTKSVDVQKVNGTGTKKQRVLDLWSDEQCLEFIMTRYEAAQDALLGGVIPAIPAAFEGWEHPLCGFCPKKAECIEIAFNGGEVKSIA